MSRIPPEQLDRFSDLCRHVGYFAVHWAVLEQTLDFMVSMAFHEGGKDAIREDIPRSLEMKVDFLKKSYRTLSHLLPLTDRAIQFLIDVNNWKENRHDLIHGALASLDNPDNTFTLLRTLYQKTMHESRTVTVDLKDFPRLSTELGDLEGRAMQLVIETLELTVQHRESREPRP